MAELTAFRLELLGYEIELVQTGGEATSSLQNSLPDLISANSSLPDGDGIEWISRVRGVYSADQVPVLVFSVDPSLETVERGFHSGAQDYLITPFDPAVDGQKLVLRLLGEAGKTFQLDSIGMTHREKETLREIIDKSHGMFVATGPTGSGKSTTLCAALQYVNRDDRNVVTVGAPVEFRLPGINQVQSDSALGMGFANALKFIMRRDPDVIMVGEIRNSETATTAVQAALTVHLMISTLHANDAVGAVQRLSDLGVDIF